MSEDTIKVAVRIKPLSEKEKSKNVRPLWNTQNETIFQIDETGQKNTESTYSFDHIFGTDKSNGEIYEAVVKDFIESSLNGINSTIFAYGQTSSGKTYTMFGNRDEKGLIPIAIDNIFSMVESSENKKFLLTISFVEIYNEKINDLLEPKNTDLKIRETLDGNLLLENVHEEILSTRKEVYDCLKRGDMNKHVGNNKMNEKSSRAHTIFKIMIERRDVCALGNVDDSSVQISNLNLVDLAGSERAAHTKATGERLKEGGHINKSLSTLSHVIRQLSDGNRYVNFRDSKLTRLLQQSLGGNAKTLIIATITLTSIDYTSSTLKFAQRAKAVKNQPKVNEVLNDADAKKRYDDLKKKLENELMKNKKLEDELTEKQQAQELERIKKNQEILRLREQINAIDKFQQPTIENSSSIPISKRRHTIGFAGQRKLLNAIQEEPSIGVETTSTYLFLESTPSTTTTSPKTTERSVQCCNLSGEMSTPRNNLRRRIKWLEEDYDQLVAYTRDENNILTETDERVKELEMQLKSTSQELSELKQQRKVEEEFITTQLMNKFKSREQELLDKINDLEQQLDYKNKSESNLPVNVNIYQELLEYVEEFQKQLIVLQDILRNCEFVENSVPTLEKSRIEDIIDSFSLKIKTSKEIIENEIWKQVNIFNQVSEKLNHSYIIPNEIDSFNELLKELLAFENDISVELTNNNEDGNVENLRVLIKIYESLLKQNQIIGLCSEKISSLQEEIKFKDESYLKYKADINEQLVAQKATISEKQKELSLLEEKCRASEEKISSLQEAMKFKDESYLKYKADINEQLVAQKAASSEKQKELNLLEKKCRASEEKISSLQEEMKFKDESYLKYKTNINEQLVAQEATIREKQKEFSLLEEKCRASKEKISLLQKEIKFKDESYLKYKIQLAAQKATISEKQKELSLLEEKCRLSEEKISSLQEEMKFKDESYLKYKADINEQLVTQKATISEKQKELSLLIEKCRASEEKISSLQEELKFKDESFAKFKIDVNEQLFAQKATISDKQKELSLLVEKCHAPEEKISSLQEEMKFKDESHLKFNADINEQINEITKKDCLKCRFMKSEISRLNQKLSNNEKIIVADSCQTCAQLTENNLKLERQVKEQEYEISALKRKHSEELKKKADLEYSDFLQFCIDTDLELRKKLEKYEERIKTYENGSVSKQSVEIQCNILDKNLFQKYREYKMVAEMRKKEIVNLRKQLGSPFGRTNM